MILKASSPAQCSWLDLQCYLNLPCHVPASLQSLLFWMKYGPAWPVVNKGSSVKSISAPLLTQVGRVEARSHTSINQGWVSLCSSGMVCEEGSQLCNERVLRFALKRLLTARDVLPHPKAGSLWLA